MENGNQGFSNFSHAEQLLPKEEMLEVIRNKKNIIIGIPKEIIYQENRVALTPEAVSFLSGHGHRIMLEAGAGVPAGFTDHDYSEAGAEVVYSPEEVYKATIVLKIAPPTADEIELCKPGNAIFSAVNISGREKEYFRRLSG